MAQEPPPSSSGGEPGESLDVQRLEDDQIRAILKSHGEPNVPVNSSTRAILLRKVESILKQDGGGVHSNCVAPPGPTTTSDHSTTTLEKQPDKLPVGNGPQVGSNNPQIDLKKKVIQQQISTHSLSLERANSYPSLTTPQLNKFRKCIEAGDVLEFERLVWENPRYLIGRGDTPEILKPPLRYNTLHCAVLSGCLPIIKKLFEILEGERFWTLVYPDDHPDIQSRRRNFLMDLYLNTCDKGAQETPLHFASKLGLEEIVAFLLTFSSVNTKAANKYGETACQMVCSRDKASSAAKKQRILDRLTDPAVYFVPVLRAVDNSIGPRLSTPCTLQELESQGGGHKLESPVMSGAIAGPMSPLEAESFYKEWRSPSNRGEAANVKRSDPDRGMERIGRRLAHHRRVGWREYWGFLDCSCDLSRPDGLKALEDYLSTSNSQPDPPPDDPEDLGDLLEAKLTLTPTKFTTPIKTSAVRGNRERMFLAGSEPTKLDLDVMRAIDECEIDSSVFPNVARWQNQVQSFSEEEQRGWRTPSREYSSRNHHPPHPSRNHTPQAVPSPLIYSSPKPPIERRLEYL